MKGTVVYVRWVDSASRIGWQFLPDFEQERRDTLVCVTLGFLVREDDKSISVAASLAFNKGLDAEPDGANSPITIPKCAILGRWEITGIH